MRKVIEAKGDDLEDIMMGKFKELSKKDKEIILSSDVQEDIAVHEGKKKDGTPWTEEEVMGLLDTNDKVLYGALKHLYACQTDAEKSAESTQLRNNVGFNAYDAGFLTSVCKQLLQRGSLSQKQKEVSRNKLKKYKRQLVELANS
jgi:hypothetical protein